MVALNQQQDRIRREEILRSRLERAVEARKHELDEIVECMQGAHYSYFPPQRNNMDRWEMAELSRINAWRPQFERLQEPTPGMFEAAKLARYLPEGVSSAVVRKHR